MPQFARHYGYKLSIHSGSDKFSVFPIIGRDSKGRFHVKTSGTHWLQSLFTAAKTNPPLFRRIYRYSLDVFHITRTYYHITPDLSNIDDIDTVDDADLERCLDNVHTRQVLHVSYGEVYKNTELKELLLGELKRHKSDYYEYLAGHLARHLDILGVEKK